MEYTKAYIKYLTLTLIVLLSAGAIYWYTTRINDDMTYNSFLQAVESNRVDEVYYSSNANYIEFTKIGEDTRYKVPAGASDTFLDYLLEHGITVRYLDTAGGSPIGQFVLLFAVAGGILYYRSKHKKSSLIQNAVSHPATLLSLCDVAGNVEAKAMVSDIISFIKTPSKYTDIGAKMPHGILFYGPPGTGKTLMAKAIAGEAGVPFYPMNGSDFIQMYVGVGASRIRTLFKTAKKAEKAVIFIDEIDAIGKKRSGRPDGGNDERDQTLNALLSELSGFHERDGIVVIAATNRLDTLDEALTRPGRFDRLIEIGLPDVEARKRILELHVRKRTISRDVNLDTLAKSTVSFSGAMLEQLVNESAIIAANEEASSISPAHMDKAFYTVIAGAEKSDTSYITPTERRITACHEAGHALITRLLLPDSYIAKVTIIPSTRGAGGFSMSIPKETMYMTKKQLRANMQMLLAGRASEELIFGSEDITTGAGNDIEKVSRMMADYISKYGMDEEFGIFNSQVFRQTPDDELLTLCRDKISVLYEETKTLIVAHMTQLEQIANALLEKESLDHSDIENLCEEYL